MCEAKVETLNIRHAFLVLAKPAFPLQPAEATPASPSHAPGAALEAQGQDAADPQLTEIATELSQLHQIADDHKQKLKVALVQQVVLSSFQ